jgi:hypothetical protein
VMSAGLLDSDGKEVSKNSGEGARIIESRFNV